MKKRIEFVSNSSSSSYVVIPDEVIDDCGKGVFSEKDILSQYFNSRCKTDWDGDKWNGIMDEGNASFEWQVVDYHDLATKWNWLVAQASYASEDKYKDILVEFLKGINPSYDIDWDKVEQEKENFNMSIDHQSVDANGTFEEVMKIGIAEWLVNDKCYVRNGNDNE